jgi:hypothetical protein
MAENVSTPSRAGDDGESAEGVPVPATSATGTRSAGKHEPVNPDPRPAAGTPGGNGSAADKQSAGHAESAGPGEGTGGDAGSGPTGAVTPEDISQFVGPEADSGDGKGRGPDGLVGAAVVSFVAGLVTGLLLGWRATR